MDGLKDSERGFLLLASRLGDPERRVLTTRQLRDLAVRIGQSTPVESICQLQLEDLTRLGYGEDMSRQILSLLEEEPRLDRYLSRAGREAVRPVTRATEVYPVLLRKRMGLDSPGCLWARGDLSILRTPTIALVGSRELGQQNQKFAWEAGRQAALQGVTLISGNARGADRTAQDACLEAGGRVISIVADSLLDHRPRRNLLYLSESSFDEPFSSWRALSRNRVIHAMGLITLVAQSDLGKGGTWSGTIKNLRRGWSPVACFRDGSEASRELEQLGAYLVDCEDLKDLCTLREAGKTLFDTDFQLK